ncbi:CotS family spore coat protein [Oceanobacillus longus]|uniref:CotS family spore coat protein n=1 Tax=Oceanobacillus longus TaxID=930120 RepID=A0ABV8GRG3_9BACI
MADQLIKPWAEEIASDSLYVPAYIEDMTQEVLKFYEFSVHHMAVMATKDKQGGAIWKIDTDQGPFSLKLLHRRPAHSKFSLGAQEYLVKVQKANVPAIIQTVEGENYVEMGGKIWFVAKWIETLQPVSEDLEGTKMLCYALGEFHRRSHGYVPPADAEHVSRLHRWPRTYERIEKKLGWFRDIATAYSDMPASATILSAIDMFENQAREARIQLANSPYHKILAMGTQEAGLAHQDYGWGNSQFADDRMWIIDLDGVSFDITIRDLRKLIIDRMYYLEKWDINWIREMIQAYEQANPITDESYEMLLIDLSLPNLFYKNIKDIVYSPTIFMTEKLDQELQLIIELDKQKWPVLEELAKDRKGGKTTT